MSKYIDADLYVEMQIYDDEHEEWGKWHGTIEELLNQWTEQGCPPTIEVSEGLIGQGSGDIDWQEVVSTGQEIYAKGYEDGRKSIETAERR